MSLRLMDLTDSYIFPIRNITKTSKLKPKIYMVKIYTSPGSTLWHWKRLLRDQVPLASKMKAKSVYLYKTH